MPLESQRVWFLSSLSSWPRAWSTVAKAKDAEIYESGRIRGHSLLPPNWSPCIAYHHWSQLCTLRLSLYYIILSSLLISSSPKLITKRCFLVLSIIKIWCQHVFSFWSIGWQKLCGGTGGPRRKVWTRTKILSSNIRYFVANWDLSRFTHFLVIFGQKSAFLGQKQCFLGKKCTITRYILHISLS